jgi:serine/threonine protein kinase
MKRKILLSLLLIITNTVCFSPEEMTEIKKSIIDKMKKKLKYLYRFGDFEANYVMECLKHPYFETRFSNFQKILGIGSYGVVIEADFQLFKDRPQTLPVAVKVNYDSDHEDPLEMLNNYVSLMVNSSDVEVEKKGDFQVYNLSKHFEKMLTGDDSIKNDLPFVGMLYEAAIIPVHPGGNIHEPPEDVGVTVVQLGFSGIEDDFLEHPQGFDQIRDKNSQNISRLIVQISFGLSRIHENGFFHGDFFERNIMVAGTNDDFYPLIIDFDLLKSRQELLQMSIPFEKQIFDQSHPNFQKYMKYCEDPDNLIGDKRFFEYLDFLEVFHSDAFSEIELKNKYENKTLFVFNINITTDTFNLIEFSLKLLNKFIEKNLIRADHPNIINLKKELKSMMSSWENRTEYLTSHVLFRRLNEASSLELTSFSPANVDLDHFLGEIKASMSASSTTQVENVKEQPGDSKDELKNVLIV